jgi:hypothetical protein
MPLIGPNHALESTPRSVPLVSPASPYTLYLDPITAMSNSPERYVHDGLSAMFAFLAEEQFWEEVDQAPDPYAGTQPPQPIVPIARVLSQVCQTWRKVAFETPRLWSVIYVPLSFSTCGEHFMLHTTLGRLSRLPGNHSLLILMDFDFGDREMHDMPRQSMYLLLRWAERWRHVSLKLRSGRWDTLSQFMKLEGDYAPLDVFQPWRNIVKLSTTGPGTWVYNGLELVTLCTSLEVFIFSFSVQCAPNSMPIAGNSFCPRHERLHTLHLVPYTTSRNEFDRHSNIDNVFIHLNNLPKLKTLVIQSDRHWTQMADSFYDFLAQPEMRLEELRLLVNQLTQEQLVKALQVTPHLKKLSIHEALWFTQNDYDIYRDSLYAISVSDYLLQRMTPGATEFGQTLVPKLQSLELVVGVHLDFYFLKEMVIKRHADAAISSIEELRFGTHGGLESREGEAQRLFQPLKKHGVRTINIWCLRKEGRMREGAKKDMGLDNLKRTLYS